MGLLLRAMIWITVVIGPVLLLALIQLIFLPYHDAWVTWWHRGLLLVDVALLWLFWPFIMLSPGRTKWATSGRIGGLALAIAIVALAVLTGFPGEPQSRSSALSFLPFAANIPKVLSLQGQQFADSLKLNNRDLHGALLTGSTLRNADLTDSDLSGAVLVRATLRSSNLTGTDLRGADLWGAQLQNAALDGAKLQNSILEEAHLEGASLAGAHFEVADLRHAHFAGSKALQEDDQPHFEGADLANADFRGADILSGQFQGANLQETDFRGARLDNASFWGSTFSETQLDAAHLKPVTLWHTTPVNVSTCFLQSASAYVHYEPAVFRGMGRAPYVLVVQQVRDKYLEDLMTTASSELDDAGRKKLRDRLGGLLSTASEWTQKELEDSKSTWQSKNQEKCEGTLPGKYVEIACSSTANVYVSRGLIHNGALDDLQPKELAEVTKALLDSEQCPAASKLTESDKEALNKLAQSQ
jgi:uncharacterized protein YjbI with pentapeptide repeats